MCRSQPAGGGVADTVEEPEVGGVTDTVEEAGAPTANQRRTTLAQRRTKKEASLPPFHVKSGAVRSQLRQENSRLKSEFVSVIV